MEQYGGSPYEKYQFRYLNACRLELAQERNIIVIQDEEKKDDCPIVSYFELFYSHLEGSERRKQVGWEPLHQKLHDNRRYEYVRRFHLMCFGDTEIWAAIAHFSTRIQESSRKGAPGACFASAVMVLAVVQ